MHADNQKQFEINMDTIARFAGFNPEKDNDREERLGLCTSCGEFVAYSELKSDGVCDHCFREFYVKGKL